MEQIQRMDHRIQTLEKDLGEVPDIKDRIPSGDSCGIGSWDGTTAPPRSEEQPYHPIIQLLTQAGCQDAAQCADRAGCLVTSQQVDQQAGTEHPAHHNGSTP
jgi:hypothetical protein